MQKIVSVLRAKSTVIVTLLLCVLVSSTSSFMIARASIPDATGTIHGCRNSTTTMLRVVDSASQSCDANESALNWDQRGVKAYGYIKHDASGGERGTYIVDANRSYNITDIYANSVSLFTFDVCVTSSVVPSNISTALGVTSNSVSPNMYAVKDATGWTSSAASTACNTAAPNANIYIRSEGHAPFFITVY